MSVLVHFCLTCSHQEAWHEGGNGGHTLCRCCLAGACDPDPEPTLLPPMWLPGSIGGLWPRGGLRNAGTMHAARTCAGSACEATLRAAGAGSRGALGGPDTDARSDPDRAAG